MGNKHLLRDHHLTVAAQQARYAPEAQHGLGGWTPSNTAAMPSPLGHNTHDKTRAGTRAQAHLNTALVTILWHY